MTNFNFTVGSKWRTVNGRCVEFIPSQYWERLGRISITEWVEWVYDEHGEVAGIPEHEHRIVAPWEDTNAPAEIPADFPLLPKKLSKAQQYAELRAENVFKVGKDNYAEVNGEGLLCIYSGKTLLPDEALKLATWIKTQFEVPA